MKTTIRKHTHTGKKKGEYASNRVYIQKAANLSDLEYCNLELETGCLFLEEQYPRETSWCDHYQVHAYNKWFWVWWKAEWRKWERDLVKHFRRKQIEVTKELWKEGMQDILLAGHMQSSFNHNYMKPVQDSKKNILL